MTETYFIKKTCKNCGKQITLNIPKGTTIQDFLKENDKCFNCGCKLEEGEQSNKGKKEVE